MCLRLARTFVNKICEMSLVEIISPSLKTKNFTQANELVLVLSVGHASMKAMLCVYDGLIGLINLYVSRAVRYFF